MKAVFFLSEESSEGLVGNTSVFAVSLNWISVSAIVL